MSVIARRTGLASTRVRATDAVERRLRERAARDLVTLAQEVLLLDPEFERAFPRERTRATAPGLAAATERLVQRNRFEDHLPRPLRQRLAELVAPAGARRTASAPIAPPSLSSLLRLVDDALKGASDLAPAAGLPHLVRAQRHWVFGSDGEPTRRALESACTRARTPAAASSALLHLAIFHADEGRIDDAIGLLVHAALLDPRSLAATWTLAVYASATGRRTLLDRQLLALTRTTDVASLRRRALLLHRQMEALSRRGVLTAPQGRARADELLLRLPPPSFRGKRP